MPVTWLKSVLSWLTDQLISPAMTGSLWFLVAPGTDWTGSSFRRPACRKLVKIRFVKI
jgi:hypothetical protein